MQDPSIYDNNVSTGSAGAQIPDNRLLGDTGDKILKGLSNVGQWPESVRARWRRSQQDKDARVTVDEAVEPAPRTARRRTRPQGSGWDSTMRSSRRSHTPNRRSGVGVRNSGAGRPVSTHPQQGRRRGLAWAGDIVLTIGLVLALFVFWEVGWSNVQADRRQDAAAEALGQQWAEATDGLSASGTDQSMSGVGEGDPFARIMSPALGDDFARTVIEGTDQAALATGPGHYTGSQNPGESGNFALAGHRDGQGAPFHDLDKLNTCDAIVVETATQWLTYRVLPSDIHAEGNKSASEVYVDRASDCMDWRTASQLGAAEYSGLNGVSVTTPDDVDVVAPVPGKPEVSAEEAGLSMLTLTTCHPLWSNAERLIVHAVLTETEMKGAHDEDWRPAAMNGDATGSADGAKVGV